MEMHRRSKKFTFEIHWNPQKIGNPKKIKRESIPNFTKIHGVNSIAPRIPPGLTWAMGNGQTAIEKGHRHRNGKWVIGNGKWDIYRTSIKNPLEIHWRWKCIEDPWNLHLKSIEIHRKLEIQRKSSENPSQILRRSMEIPRKSNENGKSQEN